MSSLAVDPSLASSSLFQLISPLNQQRATGKLSLTLPTRGRPQAAGEFALQCHLYFYLGQLVWVEDSWHGHRRWQRAVRQFCPGLLKSPIAREQADGWQVRSLVDAVSQSQLTPLQAQKILFKIAQESLFHLIEQAEIEAQWLPDQRVGNLAYFAAFLPMEDLLEATYHQRCQWNQVASGHLKVLLNKFSPDMAPTIRHSEGLAQQVSPSLFQLLTRLMQGKLTLWDVAEQIQKPMPMVMRSLLPLLRQGILSFREVGDIPLVELFGPLGASAANQRRQPLIACIDDCSSILSLMGQILQTYGCEMLPILDPISGLGLLLDSKPDLIFLDLIMPTTNGYELGQFLKKTTTFHNIPVVILTSQDRVGDRMRAKQIGAAGFLSKPPAPDKVLSHLQKLLPETLVPRLVIPDGPIARAVPITRLGVT